MEWEGHLMDLAFVFVFGFFLGGIVMLILLGS